MIHPFDDTKQLVSDIMEANSARAYRIGYLAVLLLRPRNSVLDAVRKLVEEGEVVYRRMGWYRWRG